MNYENGIIHGRYCSLRPVRVDDAEFIVSLRNEPRHSRYISLGADSAEAQRQWIISYLDRHKAGNEYYFIACDLDGKAWGTTRLYNFHDTECTGGSWVMLPGAPTAISLETYLLPIRFAFEVLSKEVMHLDVRRDNRRVCKWHEMCGAIVMKEDELNRYYDYDPVVYLIAEKLVCSMI